MKGRSFGASVGSKAAQTFGTRLVVTILGVLTGVLVARLLGPQGKGVYSGVQTLLSVPVAIVSGAGAAITYLMTKERRSIGDLFPTLAGAFGVVMLLTIAACATYSALHGWTLETVAFLLAMPPSIVLSWQQPYYVAVDGIRRLNAQTVGVAFVTLLAMVALCVVLQLGILGALAAWLVGLYVFAGFVLADMIGGGGRLHKRDLRMHARDFTRVGAQSALNAGLGLVNYRVDSIVLIALLGLPVFGVYSIAVSVGEMLFMIARSINTAIGREIGIADADRAAHITALVVRSSFAICLACAVPIALFAPPLVHAVYGPRFDGAALPLRLLLPGIVAFATTGTFASYFIFQLGRPSAVTIINLAMIAVQVTACYALIPRLGIAGAAAASTIAYIAGAVVNTLIFCKMSGLPAAALWLPRRKDFRRLRDVMRELLTHRRNHRYGSGRVVLTGAAGGVASMVREQLRRVYPLLLTDCRRVRDLQTGEAFMRANLTQLSALRKVVRGARAVIHFGAISKEADFDSILEANIRGTYNVLEAARLEGVRRVILASSGHVTGLYPRDVPIDESAPPRPDSLYGFSKGSLELLGRYYADKYGLEILCLRIGHVAPTPEHEIDRNIWLSPRDLAQLLTIGLESTDLQFETVYAISDNPARFWSLERARSLGYDPQDAAPTFARVSKGKVSGIAAVLQGESFAANGFTASRTARR